MRRYAICNADLQMPSFLHPAIYLFRFQWNVEHYLPENFPESVGCPVLSEARLLIWLSLRKTSPSAPTRCTCRKNGASKCGILLYFPFLSLPIRDGSSLTRTGCLRGQRDGQPEPIASFVPFRPTLRRTPIPVVLSLFSRFSRLPSDQGL